MESALDIETSFKTFWNDKRRTIILAQVLGYFLKLRHSQSMDININFSWYSQLNRW